MSDYIDNETVESEIDIRKIYSFPDDLAIVSHNGYRIVVHTQGITWIVLNSDEEYGVFSSLQTGKSIEEVLSLYPEESVMNVLVQIEAKKFDRLMKYNEEIEHLAYIYLTNNCNQRCKHCYMYAGDIVIDEVAPSQWIEVLDKLKANSFTGVTFTGGEVTVYKGFETIIKHAHDIGLTVTILSNGLLWTEEKIDQLHGFIDEIQISIDGYDDQSYYSVRQSHGFEKALSCVKRFSELGTRVSIAVTPLYNDLDKFISQFEPFARKLISEYPNLFIKINHELIVGRTVNPTKEENEQYKRKLKGLVERLYPDFYIEGFVENFTKRQLKKNCGYGGISFGPNGNVYWCNRIHELKSEYNVFTDDFSDIIDQSNTVRKKTSVENVSPCMDCEIRYICGGGCRLKFKNISEASHSSGVIEGYCDGKESIYEKMILSNEYFFEE